MIFNHTLSIGKSSAVGTYVLKGSEVERPDLADTAHLLRPAPTATQGIGVSEITSRAGSRPMQVRHGICGIWPKRTVGHHAASSTPDRREGRKGGGQRQIVDSEASLFP
jgi:hypothetical protein